MIDEIQDNPKTSPSQLCTFVRDSYLDRTSRPVYAVAYLLFFIVLYEIGTIIISTEILSESLARSPKEVVSFVWVKNLMGYLGFKERMSWLAAPLAVIVILLALQITSRTRWSVRIKDFVPMTAECILLAIPLIVLSVMLNRPVDTSPPAQSPSLQVSVVSTTVVTDLTAQTGQTAKVNDNQSAGLLGDIVTSIGAGIYEELVFRLVLIILLMLLFQDLLHFKHGTSIVLSVVISAVLFSAHHHIFFLDGRFEIGETFSVARFVFRALAGIYFAVLFAVRGFGITAGSHAFYDIIAALLNTYLFTEQG